MPRLDLPDDVPEGVPAVPNRGGALDETRMLRHLEYLGIDLDGFDLSDLDPIESYSDQAWLRGDPEPRDMGRLRA